MINKSDRFGAPLDDAFTREGHAAVLKGKAFKNSAVNIPKVGRSKASIARKKFYRRRRRTGYVRRQVGKIFDAARRRFYPQGARRCSKKAKPLRTALSTYPKWAVQKRV